MIPGRTNQFHVAVYDRGALAVQALRNEIGDDAFFAVLKGWTQKYAYGNASVADFQRYAEEVSGQAAGRALRHLAVPAVEAGRAGSAQRVHRQVAPRAWCSRSPGRRSRLRTTCTSTDADPRAGEH